MNEAKHGAADPAGTAGDEPRYEPGVCNIGPDEIARRRRAGHVGLAATGGLFAGLLAIRAPRPVRLLVVLPAAVAASGYLQARFQFCAGFGSRGVYNFGHVGGLTEVGDDEARSRDRMRATQIGLASLAIGVLAGAGAMLVPR